MKLTVKIKFWHTYLGPNGIVKHDGKRKNCFTCLEDAYWGTWAKRP